MHRAALLSVVLCIAAACGDSGPSGGNDSGADQIAPTDGASPDGASPDGSTAFGWSTFLDPSRAIDWTTAGFSIPNYTTNCASQPTLVANSQAAAAANSTAIQNALGSCDATHNVVNIPAGTYYIAGWTYGGQGNQVVRGAGASSTIVKLTALQSCAGLNHAVCMVASNWTYNGAANVLPPSGSSQCAWTAGYAQGTTSITLGNCGGTPPLGQTLILDQANDTSDTGGVYMCDGSTPDCTYEGYYNGGGRHINNAYYGLQQVVQITALSPLGGGSYTATISPAVYSTNIRASQTPAAWWPGFVQHDGIENITLDGSAFVGTGGGILSMFSAYQCWAKGVRFINGDRNAVLVYQTLQSVVRDSYFYGAASHLSTSYNIETDTSSGILIENNIMQQVTTPLLFNDGCTGCVAGYNFSVKTIFSDGTWAWPIFASHNTGNNFNLFEGNDAVGVTADNASGPAAQLTIFRNLFPGWQPGNTNSTEPFIMRAWNRFINFAGNVLGQPGYHTSYQQYATSPTSFSAGANSIYDLGGGGSGDVCSKSPPQSTSCDPLTFTTSMRWGNYDVVNGAVQWSAAEASPAAFTYVNANFSPSYFGSLSHTLPASLYHASTPSFWPSGKAWPPMGPDVTTGNVGVCNGGAYAGTQATASSQCTGGTLSAAWASHANSIPAQDCYLKVMSGPPDGSGAVLDYDASLCY